MRITGGEHHRCSLHWRGVCRFDSDPSRVLLHFDGRVAVPAVVELLFYRQSGGRPVRL